MNCPKCGGEVVGLHTKNIVVKCLSCEFSFGKHNGLQDFVFSKSGGRCYFCKAELMSPKQSRKPRFSNATYRLTIDHLVPRSKGGTNDPDNLVAACRKCNETKADKPLEKIFCFAAEHLEIGE